MFTKEFKLEDLRLIWFSNSPASAIAMELEINWVQIAIVSNFRQADVSFTNK